MDYQLINVKEMMELGSHHFATITVIMISVKNHSWMIELVGEKFEEKIEYLLSLKGFHTTYLLITKEK